MIGMALTEKISVTLPKPDVAFLADYMARTGASRSRALHEAVKALREQSLEEAYRAADQEWDASGEAAVWDAALRDGLDG